MGRYPKALAQAIEQLQKLPGVGNRSAERIAMHLLKQPPGDTAELTASLNAMRTKVQHCRQCFNVTEQELCSVCDDPKRNQYLLCVVETSRDLASIESAGVYTGVYHCLLGRLAPSEGIGEDDLTIRPLVQRCKELARAAKDAGKDTGKDTGAGEQVEVILATNPDLGGDATSLAVSRALDQLASSGAIKVTRLARGLPSGFSLDALSGHILEEAFEGRRALPGA